MVNNSSFREFGLFTFKVIVAHTITYFLFGLIMSNLFDYASLFQEEVINDFMRPINSSSVLFGPFLQPLRGILFAIAFWPIRNIISNSKWGWLILWNIVVMVGILSTPGAAPCSIEGVIYSKLPLKFHLIGLPEILLQTLTFSLLMVWWIKPKNDDRIFSKKAKVTNTLNRLLVSVMTASFAYIGYAIGGILIAKISGIQIDIKEASSSISIQNQLMFVFAFIVNIISVFLLSQIWVQNKMKIFTLFLVFWIIDASVPLIYQSIVSYPMSLHLALIMGFFPATIIVGTMKLNRNKLELYVASAR